MLSRRELLGRCGMGMGALLLPDLVRQAGASEDALTNPLAARRAHFPGRAKRVIHVFANGGPSHVDTFDPKPALERLSGKPLPAEFQRGANTKGNVAYPSPFAFRRHGTSGLELSELFPHLGGVADELCVVRSMKADDPNHEPSLLLMNCGEPRLSRPSMGSWLTYGLGSENQNLPGFVAMCPFGYPIYQSQNWQSGFLPGIFQGTYVDSQHTDVEKLVADVRNGRLNRKEQAEGLDLLRALNAEHRRGRADDPRLDARIQSFELAFRMQSEALDAFDASKEPEHVQKLYGPGTQARQLLVARRLVERGVRFVQVWTGREQPWDNHSDIEGSLKRLAGECDRPLAALIQDLKQRGMLEDTLVIWGGEFGRTPTIEGRPGKTAGRDHQSSAFTMWMAGGGVKAGHVHGETDEFGVHVTRDLVHVHDLHATILHLMGFDHEKFTYRYAGRDFRLTDVHGHVVKGLLA